MRGLGVDFGIDLTKQIIFGSLNVDLKPAMCCRLTLRIHYCIKKVFRYTKFPGFCLASENFSNEQNQ